MENTSANFTHKMTTATETAEIHKLDKNLLKNYYRTPEVFGDDTLESIIRTADALGVLTTNLNFMSMGSLTSRLSKGTGEERQIAWRKRIQDEDHLAYFSQSAEDALFHNNLLTRIREDFFAHYGVEEDQFEMNLSIHPDEHADVSKELLAARFDSFLACVEVESTILLANQLCELSYMGYDYPQQSAKLHQLHYATLRSHDLPGKINLTKQLRNLFESAARKEKKEKVNHALSCLAKSCEVINNYMFNFLNEVGGVYDALGYAPPSVVQDGLIALYPPKSGNHTPQGRP